MLLNKGSLFPWDYKKGTSVLIIHSIDVITAV